MLRFLISAAAFAAFSTSAYADHPEKDLEAKTSTQNKVISKTLKPNPLPNLPSQLDVEDIMSDMPDLNKLMGAMMGMMQDKDFLSTMEKTGQKLETKMQQSGALEKQANGLPDFNAAMESMLEVMTDAETVGGMMGMMTEMATELESVVEDIEKPKP